ncbi:Flp family type IVb pilin [Ruegeria lacuscaerulensis]|uniref:Flp family type IVb pilin n=1 Tax=Ruegeria lacuscaerulensis TaxID=55218 RepID=UPI001481CF13|nr:Flp family type IVb pilin [Ruegeria lacuscaerulensis]
MSNTIRNFFLKLRKDERGATLVEYGVALLLAVIVGGTALISIAEDTSANFDDAANVLSDVRAVVPAP